MNRAFLLAPLVCILGCLYGPIGPQPMGDDPAPGSTSTGSSSTGNTPTTTTSPGSSGDPEPPPILTGTDGSSSTGTTEPEVNFIPEDDQGGGDECDPFHQEECPRGTKCTWYAGEGESWYSNTKCVPVMEDPAQVDEPCLAEGNGVSGIDNCDVGMICWDTDAEGIGYCVAFCAGSLEAPTCEQGASCVVGRSLSICLESCDPLIQNCPLDEDLCIPSDQIFVCVLDASGDEGQVNDPCMLVNACDKGLYCIDPANGVECDQTAMGCCQPFCDLEVMNPDAACTGDGQTCVPWFEAGTAPPGHEFLGICAIAP